MIACCSWSRLGLAARHGGQGMVAQSRSASSPIWTRRSAATGSRTAVVPTATHDTVAGPAPEGAYSPPASASVVTPSKRGCKRASGATAFPPPPLLTDAGGPSELSLHGPVGQPPFPPMDPQGQGGPPSPTMDPQGQVEHLSPLMAPQGQGEPPAITHAAEEDDCAAGPSPEDANQPPGSPLAGPQPRHGSSHERIVFQVHTSWWVCRGGPHVGGCVGGVHMLEGV